MTPDIDKQGPYANPLVRLLPIPHLHDWKKVKAGADPGFQVRGRN